MQLIIDRIEDGIATAVLEDERTVPLDALLIEALGAVEGDVLELRRDKKATRERKRRVAALADELFID